MEEENQNTNKLIAVYGRVSTSNQENEGTIETQLSAIREFAKDKYIIAKEYLDNGWSGDNIVRPALDQLRIDAKKKIWEAVLIYDPDRLARRGAWQEVVMEELKEIGIPILYVTVPPPKSDEDVVMNKMRGVFAEYERMKIKERFRLGKVRKVKEGYVLVSEAPYGYRYIRKQDKIHGYYEIVEDEARVVKMIFSWIANDYLNIRQVVLKLQELGIKPRKSKRGVWNTSTLTNMLRNKSYIGEAHWGSSYAVVPENPIKHEKYKKMRKTSRRSKPEEEWIANKIPVSAIIDSDLFVRARAQLKINSEINPRSKRNDYLLATRIYCICGKKRCGEGPKHGQYLYYRCADRNYSFPLPSTCSEKGKSISAKVADQLVWDRIANLMSSADLLQAQIDHWLESRQTDKSASFVNIDFLGKEVAKLRIKEERFNKAYGDGVFDIEKLKEYTFSIREQITSLESQIAKARQQESDMSITQLPNRAEIETFAKNAVKKVHSLNYDVKRAIVMDVVEKIIGTQQQLEVFGILPITPNYVDFNSITGNRRPPECGEINPLQSADEKTNRYTKLPLHHD